MGTLDAAGLGPQAIESIHVGNALGQPYAGQGHLGAMAEIEAGRYDCVLVVGVEQEKTMPGREAARVQQAAAHGGVDTDGLQFIWPETFDAIADTYDRRFGLDDAHLRAIGELNLTNAHDNPNAQTRMWRLEPGTFGTDNTLNPSVTDHLRRNDCCQITDGAAGVVLVSDRPCRGSTVATRLFTMPFRAWRYRPLSSL